MSPLGTPVEILLIDADRADALVVREVFEEHKIVNALNCVTNGEDAIAYLRREGPHARSSRPDLILLSLHLPRKSGHEVLAEIKQDSDLRSIPVVVLTSSVVEEDILRSYVLHANAYVVKPLTFERLVDVVRQIDEFFLTVVTLPPRA